MPREILEPPKGFLFPTPAFKIDMAKKPADMGAMDFLLNTIEDFLNICHEHLLLRRKIIENHASGHLDKTIDLYQGLVDRLVLTFRECLEKRSVEATRVLQVVLGSYLHQRESAVSQLHAIIRETEALLRLEPQALPFPSEIPPTLILPANIGVEVETFFKGPSILCNTPKSVLDLVKESVDFPDQFSAVGIRDTFGGGDRLGVNPPFYDVPSTAMDLRNSIEAILVSLSRYPENASAL